MTYQEATEYLFSQTPSYEKQGATGYKEGLETTLALDEHFGHPHQAFRSIHIAGTNGKGSLSHLIAAEFQVSGYRVGLYTSPHLVDFRERIRVNGTPIDEDYVVKFVEEEKEFYEPLHPSFFELTTAMAFKYFKEKHVDIAVIEVGLGGRLDCTNIITPILSVITNISLDHTQLLGNSLEQIAFEKAGIIKPGVPVVIGEATPETRAVFDAIAAEQQAPIYYAEDEKEITSATLTSEGMMHYTCVHLGDFECELTGDFQPINMNTTVVALHGQRLSGRLYRAKEPGTGGRGDEQCIQERHQDHWANGALADSKREPEGDLRHGSQPRRMELSGQTTGQPEMPPTAHRLWHGGGQGCL